MMSLLRRLLHRYLASAAALVATACLGAPLTCQSQANPEQVCAREDGARFIDAGRDAGDTGARDSSMDATAASDSGSDAGD